MFCSIYYYYLNNVILTITTGVRAGVCACVRVSMFSNDSSIRLGYDSVVSRNILGNMKTRAYSIHGPCSYFQRIMFTENVLLVLIQKINNLQVQ